MWSGLGPDVRYPWSYPRTLFIYTCGGCVWGYLSASVTDRELSRKLSLRFSLIPLRVLPVPDYAVVAADGAVPENFFRVLSETRQNGAGTCFWTASDPGIVIVNRADWCRTVNNQDQKAGQLLSRGWHVGKLALFVKVMCYVGNVCFIHFL